MRLVEPFSQPVKYRSKTRIFSFLQNWPLNELCLSAFAVRWNDETLRNAIRSFWPEVLPDERLQRGDISTLFPWSE
jgi:hypothetical protein